jgi:protein gp37
MTTIEWTHRPGTKGETWNPVRGCELVSQGCKNCYAMHFAHRFSGPGKAYEGLTHKTNSGVKWNGKIHLAEDMLDLPLSWKDPRTVFVNSMSDLFHKDVPFEFIMKVYNIMAQCPNHTFLILTKRADRALQFHEHFEKWYHSLGYSAELISPDFPLPNVWVGVSAEDQNSYDDRVTSLLQINAAVRFISCEPLLGPIDLNLWTGINRKNLNLLHWVIAGGESGNGARPMHPDWVRSLRDQCKSADVPFFFKQWGNWSPECSIIDAPEVVRPLPEIVERRIIGTNGKTDHWGHDTDWVVARKKGGKKASGNLLDGKQHLEFPA